MLGIPDRGHGKDRTSISSALKQTAPGAKQGPWYSHGNTKPFLSLAITGKWMVSLSKSMPSHQTLTIALHA